MRTYTLEQFQDRTCLLPHVIASRLTDDEAFADWATERTLRLYNTDPRWRRALHRQDRREYLYAFLGHWYQAREARR